MRAVVLNRTKSPLSFVEDRPAPEPDRGELLNATAWGRRVERW